jgi:hypothetical protein
VSLKNHITGEIIPARPFIKSSLVRRGKSAIKISLVQTEQGFNRKESRVLDEITDALAAIKSAALTKGHARTGWLFFSKDYNLQEFRRRPTISLPRGRFW